MNIQVVKPAIVNMLAVMMLCVGSTGCIAQEQMPEADLKNNDKCLSFTSDINENGVLRYIDKYKLAIKKEEIYKIKIYSSSFDLNMDGKNEYFYLIIHPYFCGNISCSFHVVSAKDNKYEDLISIPILNEFTNDSALNNDFVCIHKNNDSSWPDIYFYKKIIYRYSDGKYSKIY